MFLKNCNESSRAVILLGALLALGIIIGSFVLGYQTKSIGSGRSSVTVKGLAEKPVKSDLVEWGITATAKAGTFSDALSKLRSQKKELDLFLEKQGFKKESIKESNEDVEPFYQEKEVNNKTVRIQNGYEAEQTMTITTKEIDKIVSSQKAAIDFKASGQSIHFNPPNYLVSNLEDIKMSLINNASENAKKRAIEFIKNSNASLGAMKSASQGAFYILPNSANADTDNYGGTYDKSTIDKIARVVVTVEFSLK